MDHRGEYWKKTRPSKSIEPCGTPDIISSHVLSSSPPLLLRFWFER